MAGTAYGSFAVGDANIDNVMLQTAAVEVGHCALTLTGMTTTTIPQIAAGSKIEVNGTLFHFDSNETISGSATAGTNYIYITAAGVPTWTATAPTWFDSKQGWYTAAGTSRYTPWVVAYIGTTYPVKKLFCHGKELIHLGCPISAKFYDTSKALTANTPVTINTGTKLSDVLDEVSSSSDTITFKNSGWYNISANVTGTFAHGASASSHLRFAMAGTASENTDYIFLVQYVNVPDGGSMNFNGSINHLIYASVGETLYFTIEGVGITTGASVDIYAGSWFSAIPVKMP